MAPIYYQYLNGEKRGEITTLKQIDDRFPESAMYYFDDGFKCFEDLIGEYGDKNAFKNGKVIARIQSINKKWSFKENEIREVEQKAFSDDAQMEFEIPDPYFVDKNGKRLHDAVLKSKVEAFHPSFTAAKGTMEIPAEYYMSFQKDEESKNVEVQDISLNDEIILEEDNKGPMESQCNDSPLDYIPIVKIEEPKIRQINLDYNGDIDAVINIVNTDKNPYHKMLSDISVKAFIDAYLLRDQIKDEHVSDAMVLLTDSCKKILTPIDMALEIELPNKSFYHMISENYGDSSFDECISHIINKLDISIIKEAIKDALIKSYKGEEIQ